MRNRILVFIIFLACGISLPSLSGMLIFTFSGVSSGLALDYTFALSVVFLIVSILLRSRQSLRAYWRVFFAFFIASFALLLDFSLNIPSNTMSGILLDMLLSTSIIVSTIILLSKISGKSASSIFLKRGKLKLGIAVGLIGFFLGNLS